MNTQPYIVGIAGGTGSGKTTLAEKIHSSLAADVLLIRHDNYYVDQKQISYAERVNNNYDHPLAFQTALLVAHLDALRAGNNVNMPEYDFRQHVRKEIGVRLVPKRIIVVEGILVLENEELRNRLDLKLYVDTDSDIRVLRRMLRDINERGRTVASVMDQYLRTVKPMHEQFVEPSKRHADIIVPEGGRNQVAVDMIVARLRDVIRDSK